MARDLRRLPATEVDLVAPDVGCVVRRSACEDVDVFSGVLVDDVVATVAVDAVDDNDSAAEVRTISSKGRT